MMAKNRRFRRGMYLLPTLFTVGNLFCGYWSLIHTLRGALETERRCEVIFTSALGDWR